MKTEKEKMLAGEVYYACDPLIIKELNECKDLVQQYNSLRPTDLDARREMLQQILGDCDKHVLGLYSVFSDLWTFHFSVFF